MVLHVVTSLLGGVPLCNSLGIVQWNSTRRDHLGNLGGVSGSGPVTTTQISHGSHGCYIWISKTYINSIPRFGTDQTAPHGLIRLKHS